MARQNVQDREDITDTLSNLELIERYRLDRDSIYYLNDNLGAMLSPRTERNHSLRSVEKILVCLRYLATSTIQLNAADLHSVSQATVSRVISQVTDAVTKPEFIASHICFPTALGEVRQIKEDFYNIAGFPNVVGVVDGTHVQIQAPSIEEPMYVNRMGYHPINTQVVFDGQCRITDLVARWPGSTHDSRVLRGSGLFQLMQDGALHGAHNYLLGDSGYPCKCWLLTPYINPVGNSQLQYNTAHKSTRSVVERGIGQLKRRWGILRGELRVKPEKACKIILSCGVLHNICKARQIPLPEVNQVLQVDANDNNNFNGPQEGLHYRDFIAANYFKCIRV